MENKILILDIETTGFLQNGGKIVEIGIVSLNLQSGEITPLFGEVTHEKGITKEEVEISWIVKNSSLTTEMVRHSTRLDKLQPKIQEIINAYPLGCTAYNNAFDFGFLESRGFTFPKKLADPMKLLTPILKIPKRGGFGYKWPSVEESVALYLGKNEYKEEHRGLQDAIDEAEIVWKLYREGLFTV